MSQVSSDLAELLATLEPTRHPGEFAYCVVPHGADVSAFSPVATVSEPEGLTLILPEAQAARAGLPVRLRVAWITLSVQSDLEAVGLTAAFASDLGNAGVACNVVAGAFHDHIFVPVDQADLALATLKALQRDSA